MTADEITVSARSWLGVPWLHQGRTRRGIDCVGLVIVVARELGAVPEHFDVTGYSRQPDGTMLELCREHLLPASPAPGCVAVIDFGLQAQHMGFLAPYRHGGMSLVHAASRCGCVIEHRLDSAWRARIVGCFALEGLSP